MTQTVVVFAFTLSGTGYTLARPTLRQDIEYPKIEVNPDAKIAWPGVCQPSFQPTARGSGKQGKEYTPPRQPQAKIDIGLRVQIKRTQDRRLDHTLAERVEVSPLLPEFPLPAKAVQGSNLSTSSEITRRAIQPADGEFGQGNGASTDIGSPTMPLNQDRSAERQSSGRSSTDGTEEGSVMDLEDKPRPPLQVPSGAPAGLDENLNPPDESPPAQAGTNTSTQPRSAISTAKRKTSKSKPSRKKIKATDTETEDRGDLMADDHLTKAYYKKELHAFLINDTVMRVLRPNILGELQGPVSPPAAGANKLSATKALMRLLKETGIIAESVEAEVLFDLKLSEIKQSVQSLFQLLAPLVGEPDQTQKQPTQSKSTATRSTLTKARSTPIVAPGDQTAVSSPCVSDTEEVESSDSEEPPRMPLGPAGAAMRQNRAKQAARRTPINPRDTLEAVVNSEQHPPEKLELFF
ncbi:unnamed protein product [Phytophthora fragariaefolia]|uniref:Unnamed protein product n=1 Tax=Phytophthora fragariaefolia TaxID=1490495 RepID=A0A9W6Y117_9STRA|nr:unnamed protein product [Phytophthora fragariaefolia]